MSGLLHSFLYYLFGRGFSSVLMFAQFLFLTQVLSPEEYGRFSYIFTAALFYNALFFHWIRVFIVRYLEEKGFGYVFRFTVKYFVISFIAGAALLSVVAVASDTITTEEGILLALLLLALGWFETNVEIFRAQIRPDRYNFHLVLKSLAVLGCTLPAVLLAVDSKAAVLGSIAGYVLASLPMSLILVRSRNGGEPAIVAARAGAREDILYGITMSAGVIIPNFFIFIDKTLIAQFAGDYGLGVFSVIHDFGYKFLILPTIVVNQSCYPLIVREYVRGDSAGVSSQIRRNYGLLFAIGIFISALAVTLGGDLSSLLLKTDGDRILFMQLMPLLAVGLVLDALRKQCYDVRFLLKGFSGGYALYMGLFVIVGVVIKYLLIAEMGIVGAFVALILGALTGLLLSGILGDRSIRIEIPWVDLCKISLAAFGAWTASLPVSLASPLADMLVRGSLFGAAFGLLCFGLDALSIRDVLWRACHAKSA